MQVWDVLNSLTFRTIAKYVTVLSASVFILLGSFYVYFSYTSFQALGDSVLEELQTLQLVYRGQSLEGVEQYISDQQDRSALDGFSYLVTDSAGEKVAGDLPATPRYREFDDGWLGFEVAMQSQGESIEVDFLAHPMDLGDGYQVIVARNYADIVSRAELVFRTLLRVVLATILLGMIGGFFSAANTLSRVERLNREISRIIRSEPGQRLDVEGEKGYVRALSSIVNEMLEQMESLMQGVRRVSDNIAHDLRTPLTRMRNDLSQLRSRTAESESQQLERIIEECDDLLSSFNALLRISALESGKGLSGGTEVELGALLKDVVELYEPLAQERGIEVALDSCVTQVCRGEADLLFQMFANVLDNAIKYSPNQGRIRVELSPVSALESGDSHSIVIGDSGPGIPTVERKNVFRRFYRVESSRTEQPGHGLGLSLVQAIAQYHYGRVELGSNNPGLQVRIKLP
ncbi:MAG: signal transduction histidine kinase [Halioglobus sp.]|jgi:signal transduction histidine kinase